MNRTASPTWLLCVLLVSLLVPGLAYSSDQAAPPPASPLSTPSTWGQAVAESAEGLSRAVGGMPSGLSRQQARRFLRQTFRQTPGVASGWRTAAKISKVARVVRGVDIAFDVGEIGYAAKQGGRDAALVRGTDVALNNASAWAGAALGAKAGAKVGLYFGPKGVVIGGAVGGVAGAVATTLGYHSKIKPVFDKKIKKILEDQQAKKRPSPDVPPPWREPRPPEIGSPDKPPPSLEITLVNLAVVPPGEVHPGGTAQFRALADFQLDSPDSQMPPYRQNGVDVTAQATWYFNTGQQLAPGKISIGCDLEGQAVTAAIHFLGQMAAGGSTVKTLPVTGLSISAGATTARPGDNLPLTAVALCTGAYCETEKPNPPGVEYVASEGASTAGANLIISPDTASGSVIVYGIIQPANIRSSNTVIITILPPTLERIEVSSPGASDVCQAVTFQVFGYYSNKPGEPKLIPPDTISWAFSGRCAQLGTNVVRATWPGEVITARASTPEGLTATAQVTVNPLPHTSPWFPLEDVSFISAVKVGETAFNRALEFACRGSRHAPQPAVGVEWRSDAPDILTCTPNGVCTGQKPGMATIRLIYRGKEVTSRVVTVYEDTRDTAKAGEDKEEPSSADKPREETKEDTFEAGEEVTGDTIEQAAREGAPEGETSEGTSGDGEGDAGYETGRAIGQALGKILAGALKEAGTQYGTRDTHHTSRTPPPGRTPPPTGDSSRTGGGAGPTGDDDPFAGTWYGTGRMVQASDPEIFKEFGGRSESGSITIRKSGDRYVLVGYPPPGNYVKTPSIAVTASGGRLIATIQGPVRYEGKVEGRDFYERCKETMTFRRVGQQLEGTIRHDYYDDLTRTSYWYVNEFTGTRR